MNNTSENLITSATKPILYKNFNEIDFSALKDSHYYSQHFISSEGLNFEDYVGIHYLTGNQLIYYPQLAIKLRELTYYPTLKRTFEIDETLKGMEFIEYFYQTVKKSHAIFKREHEKVCTEVNKFIELHGSKRQTPIITALEKNDEGHYYYHSYFLFINDVRWCIDGNAQATKKITEHLNLRGFLNIPHEYAMFLIDNVKIGTPFIAIRLGKTWRHKGQVYWFNLDTGKPVSKSKLNYPK